VLTRLERSVLARLAVVFCASAGLLGTRVADAVEVDLNAEADAKGATATDAAAAESSPSGDVAAPTTPPTEQEAAEAEPPAAEPPAPETAEAKPAPPNPPLVQVYGIIKPELIVGKSVETFGRAMMVAPTAAAHPIADPNYAQMALSFQLQQSRVGIKINDGNPVSGRIEIDFIDDAFSHSSPIQGAGLRLRLAYVTYKPSAGHTLMLGQNWDVFSPLNALTMNMVGNSYQAGNVAFLRPQFAYTYGTGQGIEVTAAVGLRSQNTTASINALEVGLIPTFALQIGSRKGKTWFGLSGIIGAEQANPPPDRTYNATFAGNLFGNFAVSEALTLVTEAYIGQNSQALGLLSLGTGANVVDVGGFVSGNWKFAKMHAVWLTLGASGVLNPADLPLGYTPAVAATPTTPAVAAARVGIGGMEVNANLRATYVLSPLDGLQFYVEPYLFLTRHKLAAAEDPTGELANRAAFGAQIGTRYTF